MFYVQGSINFRKTGSQQKFLVANKSCAHIPNRKKNRHFEFEKKMYTTTMKNLIIKCNDTKILITYVIII